ncbi:hypothetical protein IAI53_10525 [Thauera sp. CAU 1555]|uniref:Uncharacterized protein n=1 Tax=Thauera sedimentorum TaxID=2767595 RepID=A0ABR9BDK6_9RHOO|nr:hypothetical protein [Thauera sedimentorum]MBC9072397.1 hypothetical protein [Thauera sedimentorum]MBD8503316.1 hypothetical protein [Thauera sedimentorum]
MTEFFLAFWPNLASTVLGVVLGVPVALLLNRRFLEHQQQLERTESSERLGSAVDVLVDACEYNSKVLDRIAELALSGRAMRNVDLRLTTWDAVGAMLSGSFSDPELLQMLSHHWLRLKRLEDLNHEIFSREVVGMLPEIMAVELKVGYWQELHDNAINLSAHASQAADKLKKLKGTSAELTVDGKPSGIR